MNQFPVNAESISAPKTKTIYPQQFSSLVEGRTKRKLGDFFGLTNFGVNLTQLAPGAISALFHHHSKQDEFIYILEGTPFLILGDKEYMLQPGDCYGFKAGDGAVSHQLINKSSSLVKYIEIGDRTEGDNVEYPNDDLKARQLSKGEWELTHKDGRAY